MDIYQLGCKSWLRTGTARLNQTLIPFRLMSLLLLVAAAIFPGCTTEESANKKSPLVVTRLQGITGQIAFVSPLYGISIINADGSQMTQLRATSGAPSWSPDGTQLVFAGRDVSGSSHIYVMQADGTGVIRLTNSGGTPSWSPNGKWIAYSPSSILYRWTAPHGHKSLLHGQPRCQDNTFSTRHTNNLDTNWQTCFA